MINKHLSKYLYNFPKSGTFYINYSSDKKFKFIIYKNKIILQKLTNNTYTDFFLTKLKTRTGRWKEIKKIVNKHNSDTIFLNYYSIQVI